MAPRRPRRSSSRRNPAASLLHTFVSGVTANLGTAVGAAVETLVISAGAVAIDRLLLKRGDKLQVGITGTVPTGPADSPAGLETFLRSNHQIAHLLAHAAVLQLGTLPGTSTHEVVFGLPDGTRLAARCTPDGQITLKQLPAVQPAAVITVVEPPPAASPRPTPAATVDDFGIIDCTQSANGEWEPVS